MSCFDKLRSTGLCFTPIMATSGRTVTKVVSGPALAVSTLLSALASIRNIRLSLHSSANLRRKKASFISLQKINPIACILLSTSAMLFSMFGGSIRVPFSDSEGSRTKRHLVDAPEDSSFNWKLAGSQWADFLDSSELLICRSSSAGTISQYFFSSPSDSRRLNSAWTSIGSFSKARRRDRWRLTHTS